MSVGRQGALTGRLGVCSCPIRNGRGLVVALVIAVLGLLGPPARAAAAPGDLDLTFGTGGVTSLGAGTQLYGVAAAPDGEVVAVGSSGSSLLVERFSAAGAPTGASAAGLGVGRAVVVQLDGKIVVAGSDGSGVLVERFNANGSPDGSFGSGGVVHPLAGGSANAVALGPAGTIVVAGAVPGADAFARVAVLRLSANGSPDASLGAGGVHVVDLGQDSVARGVAVQGDGKIVLAGSQGPGAHQVVSGFVARTTTSGALDLTFGTKGAFFSYPRSGGAVAAFNAVALDPAGGIVVDGGATTTNQSQAVFARLTCSGALDRSFNRGGLEATPSSQGFVTDPLGANGVAIVGGRRVVGAGQYQDSGLASAALWGFEAGGHRDFTTLQPSIAESNAVAVNAGGNLVVAGSLVPAGFAPSGFVARYIGFGAPASGTSPYGGAPAPPPTPPASPPSVVTGPASQHTAGVVSVSGSVNPNGQATSYHFDYGTSTAYGSQTPPTSAGSGIATVPVTATTSGFHSGTSYHYRLVAASPAGTSYGSDATFTPLPAPITSKLRQSHRTWREGGSRQDRRPVGTRFSFTLNENARVVFAFTQTVRGRTLRGRCVAATNHNRTERACRRTVTRAKLAFAGHAGANELSFRGHISRSHALKPGAYKLVVIATNAVGQGSRPRSLSFRIRI